MVTKAKDVLLVADGDATERATIRQYLDVLFGERFELVVVEDCGSALGVLRRTRAENREVLLGIARQRLPDMAGLDLLDELKRLYPAARTVLIATTADAATAVRAINEVHLDRYLVTDEAPLGSQLASALRDLLGGEPSEAQRNEPAIEVIGPRWSPETHRVKDFLARNDVPYQWLDVEHDPRASELLRRSGAASPHLPLVLLPDGERLERPSTAGLAERIGLHTHAEERFYDLIIVGGGPAGLAAGVYGASEGLNTVLIERVAPGGQAGTSSRIENYLGFPAGLSGADLAQRAVQQAERFGVEVLAPVQATGLTLRDAYRGITLASGETIGCRALVLAMGVTYRRLDVPGIERLTGKGVYYGAAMTEAVACQDERVYIVGSANSAGQAAMFFARYAHTVTMLVRGDSLSASMSRYLIEEIEATSNIEVCPHTEVVEARGEDFLESLTLENNQTNQRWSVPATSLFIFIGAEPHTRWLGERILRDRHGFILTGPNLLRHGKPPRGWPLERAPYLFETSVPGIFAAGDVRSGSVKRVASAVGEGAVAVQLVHEYLSTL